MATRRRVTPKGPKKGTILCVSDSLRGWLTSGAANVSAGEIGGGVSSRWDKFGDDNVVAPEACDATRSEDEAEDTGDDGRSNPSFVGRLSCGGIGGKSPVAPLPEPDAPDACVVIRFSAAEDDSGSDARYNHAHLSAGLSCGGIGDNDSGGKFPVAPLPEPDAPDACVVMRLSDAGDESGGSGHNNHAHRDMSVGRSPWGAIGGDDSGGKLPISTSSEPCARFSEAALATSKYLCRTAAGAAIATFATEKIRRIRTNILSGCIFVDVTVMTL